MDPSVLAGVELLRTVGPYGLVALVLWVLARNPPTLTFTIRLDGEQVKEIAQAVSSTIEQREMVARLDERVRGGNRASIPGE